MIGFQITSYTKCINIIIDSIGPSIILRSIVSAFVLVRVLGFFRLNLTCPMDTRAI